MNTVNKIRHKEWKDISKEDVNWLILKIERLEKRIKDEKLENIRLCKDQEYVNKQYNKANEEKEKWKDKWDKKCKKVVELWNALKKYDSRKWQDIY